VNEVLSKYDSILIIDDHNMVVISLRLLIGHLFREFYHTRDGAAGIMLATQKQPRLVIVDNQLPDLPGDAVVRQIRLHCPQTRILGYSFSTSGVSIRKMYEAGVNGYVDKSESDTELNKAVQELMEGRTISAKKPANKYIEYSHYFVSTISLSQCFKDSFLM
jgi:two-component system response regulator EvgA